MLNLIKYDFKGRSKILLSVLALFIIENIYVTLKVMNSFNKTGIIFMNIFFTSIAFVGVSFFLNLISFNNNFYPKPGYMIFMANVSRKKYLLTKFLTFFMESFFIGIFSFLTIFIEGKILNINMNMAHTIENLERIDVQGIFQHFSKIIFYFSLQYLTLISIFMLAITIRNFLLKNTRLKGLITFIFANILFFFRNYLYELLNINYFENSYLMGNAYNTISSSIIMVDVIYLVIIIYALIYLVEHKLDI